MQDIHLHLSGSTSFAVLFEIINKMGLRLKTKDFFKFRESLMMKKKNVNNLDEYVQILHVIDEAQSSPQAIEHSFYSSYIDAAVLGCKYLEIRWNPYKRSQDFKIDFDKLIVSARSGYEQANSVFGIKGGQIFCLGRELSSVQNDSIFKKAIDYAGKGVLGIDVAGVESRYPLKPEFYSYYKFANTFGLTTTIHAGEEYYEGVDNVLSDVIEKYKVKRIGHGIQIVKFPKLMEIARKNNVVFEICISSNLMTNNVKDVYEYARILKKFEENNLKYVICTDAVHPLGTNIVLENKKHEKIKSIAKKMQF